MKKVLFATTALVLSAGFASAEVAVSGDGRMGVVYDGNDAQFSSRVRAKFTLTGESDAGLSFGGSFRVDQQDESGGKASAGTAGAVWISGTYGKLSMGDVVSASEKAIDDLYDVGYTEGTFGGDIEEISFLTGDGANTDQGPNILYEYTINNISLYASASDGVDTDPLSPTQAGVSAAEDTASTAYSLAAKYDGSTWWAALGYAKHDDASEIVLGGEAKFNNFSVKGVFAKYDDRYTETVSDEDVLLSTEEFKHTIGLSASYQMDAILLKGFYRKDKWETVETGADTTYDSWGIGADYDLGGGAVLAGGIVDSDYLADTVADLGIKFTF
ncbi:MAG: porin [Paracoccus sp. (in: a-proteobacteria)]|uniref:porin n=1 Tax=Paracoccus sp. TaxID=267 RepID=UPI0039E3A238